MIDIHTHILPGMDDGSEDEKMSLAMLQAEKEQGVNTVILTSHFYRDKETPKQFLLRRQQSLARLIAIAKNEELPELILGAEVTWIPGLAKWEELPELCLGNSSYLLLELPFYAWPDKMMQEIYDLLLDREITPIFAHLERYTKYQKKSYLEEIIKLETPIQLSCTPLADFWQRRPLIKMLNQSAHCVFASDCHNMERRPPNLQEGMKELSRVCGMKKVHEVQYNAECLIQTMERYKF